MDLDKEYETISKEAVNRIKDILLVGKPIVIDGEDIYNTYTIMFLKNEYKNDFNTKQLIDSLDPIQEGILIELMTKFKKTI
jgi:hypothetical protein